MVLNTNNAAVMSSRFLDQTTQAQRKSLARLASGSRIVSPEDDAAGLSEAAKLHNQSLRDSAARQVLANSASFLQTRDGYLQKVQKALDRMSELSVLAQDATKTDTDRSNYDSEFQSLTSFINDVGDKTFNGKSLFYSDYSLVDNGTAVTWTNAEAAAEAAGGHLTTITSPGEQKYIAQQLGGTLPLDVWIGATDQNSEGQYQWITGEAFLYSNWSPGEPNDNGAHVENYAQLLNGTNGQWNDLPDSYATIHAYLIEKGQSIVINGDGDSIQLPTDGIPYLTDSLSTATAAKTALTNVKSAIESVARARGNGGAILQRVEAESDTLSITGQNLDEAVSRIQDTDVATESTSFARQSILLQSGTAMLAQANALPQSMLKLLG